MAEERIPLAELNLNTVEDKVLDINGKSIILKQYLPMNDKVSLIEEVVEKAGEINFANPLKLDVFFNLALIENYTNIGIDADKPLETYDLLEQNGIFTLVIQNIPTSEYNGLITFLDQTIKGFYDYKNSALGIMETISTDYSNLKLDSEEIRQNLGDKNNLSLLKDVVTKLG